MRCLTLTGSLDLVVPTADVPLIKWFFGGQPDVPDSVLLDDVIAPMPARELMDSRLASALAVVGFLLILAATAVAANVRGMSAWTVAPDGVGFFLIITGSMNILRGRRQKRKAVARPDTR